MLELENGYTIEREVSGFALENGDYVVQDPTNNTRMKSFNEIIVKGGKNYVRHNGNLYQIKSQFHTHPSGINYTEGVGVSGADLRLMNNTLNGAPMSSLIERQIGLFYNTFFDLNKSHNMIINATIMHF